MKQRYLVGKMNVPDEKEDGGHDEVTMDTLGEGTIWVKSPLPFHQLYIFFWFSLTCVLSLQLTRALKRASCSSDSRLAESRVRTVTPPKQKRAAALHFSAQVPSRKGTSRPAPLWDLRLWRESSLATLKPKTHLLVDTASWPTETPQRACPPRQGNQPHPLPSPGTHLGGRIYASCHVDL